MHIHMYLYKFTNFGETWLLASSKLTIFYHELWMAT